MTIRHKKKPIKYKKERVLRSDILPYENPVTFSNRQFYDFLVVNKIAFDCEDNRIKWEKADPVLTEIVRLLFALDVKAGAKDNTIRVDKKDLRTIPFTYKIFHKENDFRDLTVIHPINQIGLVEFYDKYKEVILHYCGISPFSIRKPDRVARFVYYKDKLHLEKKAEWRSPEIIEERGKEYENLRSFFVYTKYSNVYKFYESYLYHRCEKKYNDLFKFDISRCFDSIYTHSINWALLSRDIVKDNLEPAKKTFGGKFDQLMQDLNYGETNGIVIGPEFSRIFAEIILQKIDRDVLEILIKKKLYHKKDYEIFRYVDDYFVFFNDTGTKDEILKAYRLRLKEYKLHVNDSKTILYTKPIITEITIAKQKITELLDKYLIYKIEEKNINDGEDEKTGSIYVSSDKLITKFKTIIKETGVEYRDILNYLFSVIEQKVYKILKDYQMLAENKSEKGLINAILEILDFTFFVYSVSPRVNITIKLCRILRRLTEFLKNRDNINIDHQHLAFKSIYDDVSFILRKNKTSEHTQVETLQLLIALAELGKEYWLDNQVLCSYFNIDISDSGGLKITKPLNYFSIVVLLFYIKNKIRYNDLRVCLQEDILTKFKEASKGNIGKNTELVLLLFDVLACPYIKDDFKKEILSLHGIDDKNLQLDIMKREKNWFTKWTDFDLGDELDAKKSREVY